MKERILFVPAVNGTELMRTMARFGVNTFNVRVMNSIALAKHSLMKSGKSVTEQFVTRAEESAVVAKFLGSEDYFSITSYSDAENIASTLDSLRMLVDSDEEKTIEDKLLQGEFVEKNKALASIYKQYINELITNNQIDSIMLIRKAIDNAKKLDSEFVVLKEYPLSPLENALLDAVANSYDIISLSDLFAVEEKDISIKSYISAYGASNEVENIIGTIFESDLPLDQCVIATPSPAEYAQLFYNLCSTYDIPVNFGGGIPIANSYPATILKLFNSWHSTGYHGIDSLNALIFCEGFNRDRLIELFDREVNLGSVIELAGNLKLSLDIVDNQRKIAEYSATISDEALLDTLECAKILCHELEKGAGYIVTTYSKVRNDIAGRIDKSAIKVIADAVEAYQLYSGDNDVSEIVPDILSKSVCSENSREGMLYITSLNGAIASMRENLFIAGMSADNFPGKANENYLALDGDYLLFGDSNNVPISENKIRDKKNTFNNLITLATNLGANIYASYSNFKLAELKDANPSSALFELFRLENGSTASVDDFNKSLKQVGFFEQKINPERLIGENYIDGKQIVKNELAENEMDFKADLTNAYRISPSYIDSFLECKRKFEFAKILKLEDDSTDDPFCVIAPNVFGDIVHSLMETKGNTSINRDEFISLGKKMFDDYMKLRPAILKLDENKAREEFIETIITAFDTDPNNEVVSSEEHFESAHPSGITLHGYVDRIEKLADGTFMIVDYKTGYKIKHIDNDPITCMQTLLYAYLVEQKYGKVSKCEYRYLRKNRVVSIDFDDIARQEVENVLNDLKGTLDNGEFSALPRDEKACDKCPYADVCTDYQF